MSADTPPLTPKISAIWQPPKSKSFNISLIWIKDRSEFRQVECREPTEAAARVADLGESSMWVETKVQTLQDGYLRDRVVLLKKEREFIPSPTSIYISYSDYPSREPEAIDRAAQRTEICKIINEFQTWGKNYPNRCMVSSDSKDPLLHFLDDCLRAPLLSAPSTSWIDHQEAINQFGKHLDSIDVPHKLKTKMLTDFSKRLSSIKGEHIESKIAFELSFFQQIASLLESFEEPFKSNLANPLIIDAFSDLLSYGHREFRTIFLALFINQLLTPEPTAAIDNILKTKLTSRGKPVLSRILIETFQADGYNELVLNKLSLLMNVRNVRRDISKQTAIFSSLLFFYSYHAPPEIKNEILARIVDESDSASKISSKLSALSIMLNFDHKLIAARPWHDFDIKIFFKNIILNKVQDECNRLITTIKSLPELTEKQLKTCSELEFSDEEKDLICSGMETIILDQSRDPVRLLHFLASMLIDVTHSFLLVKRLNLLKHLSAGKFSEWHNERLIESHSSLPIPDNKSINLALFTFRSLLKDPTKPNPIDAELYEELLLLRTFDEVAFLVNSDSRLASLKIFVNELKAKGWNNYTLEESEDFDDFVLQGVEANTCYQFNTSNDIHKLHHLITEMHCRLFIIRDTRSRRMIMNQFVHVEKDVKDPTKYKDIPQIPYGNELRTAFGFSSSGQLHSFINYRYTECSIPAPEPPAD